MDTVDTQLTELASLPQADIAAIQTRYDASVSQALQQPAELRIEQSERTILRYLAGKVGELAVRPIEDAKRRLWLNHNRLDVTRPVVFCDPENGWNEIIPPNSLECRSQLARRWEMHLRKEIFWGESMGDDYTVEPFFNVFHIHTGGLEEWGLKETLIGGENGGSYHWHSPLKSEDDLARLHYPTIKVDWPATHHLAELAEETLGDLLTVQLRTNWWWSLGMTMRVAFLRGLQPFMFDLIDNPELVHRLMAFMRDGTLALLDFLERNELLSLNNDGAYVGSGGLGWTTELPADDFNGQVRTRDMWGFAESQETVGISPQMFAEFIFPYQLPILERFGLNCYGCCEPLDSRWHIVSQIPRLRRVSISPWANISQMAERLGNKYIFSMKPHPGVLATPVLDEDRVRTELRQALRETRDCRVEIIMKDNHTIGNNPQNVICWCRIAGEEADRLS
ncbi:MAG: hypothetical protein J5I90_19045 [Caldilineales bacterium]|nr:hypothetical protein [Caldilineales bacterium]